MLRTLPCLLLVAACGSVETSPDGAVLADATSLPDAALVEPTPDAAPPDAAPPGPLSNVPGKHEHTLVVGGITREVIVYVPAGALGPTPVPAVLVFHGTNGDGERAFDVFGWRQKSDEVGAITVYPSALVHCFHDEDEITVVSKWSQGTLGDVERPLCTPAEIAALPAPKRLLADHPLADDVAFTSAILDLLAAEYAVDAAHIYATGFSNGGSFTSRLAVEMPDRFAAVASSGGTLKVDTAAASAIPILFTVGADDPLFTTPMMVTSLPLSQQLMVPGWMDLTVNRYLAAQQLESTFVFAERTISTDAGTNPRKVVFFTFLESPLGAPNAYGQVVIEGLGHIYANGINHTVSYPDELWTFFQKY